MNEDAEHLANIIQKEFLSGNKKVRNFEGVLLLIALKSFLGDEFAQRVQGYIYVGHETDNQSPEQAMLWFVERIEAQINNQVMGPKDES